MEISCHNASSRHMERLAWLPVLVALIAGAIGLSAHAEAVDPRASNLRPAYGQCVDRSHGEMAPMTACMDAEFDFQDKRLNRAYKELMSTMAKPAMPQLRAEERHWIAQRDLSCNSGTEPGQFDEINAYDCKIIATADRAANLEKRLHAGYP